MENNCALKVLFNKMNVVRATIDLVNGSERVVVVTMIIVYSGLFLYEDWFMFDTTYYFR